MVYDTPVQNYEEDPAFTGQLESLIGETRCDLIFSYLEGLMAAHSKICFFGTKETGAFILENVLSLFMVCVMIATRLICRSVRGVEVVI